MLLWVLLLLLLLLRCEKQIFLFVFCFSAAAVCLPVYVLDFVFFENVFITIYYCIIRNKLSCCCCLYYLFQAFLFDGESGKLFVGQKGFNSCVGGDAAARSLLQLECTDSSEGISMKWRYNEPAKQLQLLIEKEETEAEINNNHHNNKIKNKTTTTPPATTPLCMRIFAFPQDESPHAVELAACDPQDEGQHITFVP